MNGVQMPLVTVIIIVLNGERFIEEAIASVIAQEGVDWELLVVDDGSTDRTVDIVAALANADPGRIKLLFHPGRDNAGMGASRNLGIANASGDYIAFLDADDLFLPGKLAEQAAILDAEQDAGMVYGRTLIWHSWQPDTEREDRFYDLGVEPDRTYPSRSLFRTLIENRHQTPTTCNAMMRRSAVLDLGGFNPGFRGMFEDQEFFAKLMLRYPVHVSSRTWAWYRQHDSISAQAKRKKSAVARAHLRFLAAIFDHARKTKDAGPDEYRVIARKWFEVSAALARRRSGEAVHGLTAIMRGPPKSAKDRR